MGSIVGRVATPVARAYVVSVVLAFVQRVHSVVVSVSTSRPIPNTVGLVAKLAPLMNPACAGLACPFLSVPKATKNAVVDASIYGVAVPTAVDVISSALSARLVSMGAASLLVAEDKVCVVASV